MNIGCIRDYDSFKKLEPEWNALLQQSESDSIFLTWEWISTWWEIFGADFEMRVLTDFDANGKLRGIAPLMIGRDKGSFGRNFRCLMIIGQRGDTLAEYLDFLIRPGCEREATTSFVHYITNDLAADWDYVFFERILTSSPNFSLLESLFRRQNLRVERDGKMPSPFLGLPLSWDDLMKSQSKNFRSQWNNSWNRLTRDAEIKLHFAGKDLPIEDAFKELARLHRLRWEDESASFCTEKYLQFHHQLSRKLHKNGCLLFMLISANGEYIAARYDFIYGNKIWCFQGGWNPAYDSKRVGTILTGKIIEWGIQQGLQEYDFLGGEADYKKRWADGERVMMNLTTWNRKRFRGRFCEFIFRCKAAKHWIKNYFCRQKIYRSPNKETSMSKLPFTHAQLVEHVGSPVAAVVFGVGEPQGLAAMRGLGRAGIPVYAVGKEGAVGFHSRYAREAHVVPDTHLDPAGVMNVILALGKKLKTKGVKVVLLPTQDSMVELLSKNKTVLQEFFVCHFPDSDVIGACSDKKVQYETAEKLGVPYPKTYFEDQTERLIDDLETKRLQYPLIFKARKELPRAIRGQYRLSIIKDMNDLKKLLPAVAELKIPFIIQEIIPGEDDTLYTMGSCRTQKGELSAIFTGRKLRQTPPHFGVCRVGESKLVPEIIGDGEKLLRALNYFGISQVETKYDHRDGKYKLIEVNPRPWAWVGLPVEMGINLPYAFFCDALGIEIPRQEMTDCRCVYIYLYEDLYCSIAGKDGRPWVHLFRNYEKIVEPFFNTNDLKPGLLYFARCVWILCNAAFRKVLKMFRFKRDAKADQPAELKSHV